MLFEASCGILERYGHSWRLELTKEIGESSESENGGSVKGERSVEFDEIERSGLVRRENFTHLFETLNERDGTLFDRRECELDCEGGCDSE